MKENTKIALIGGDQRQLVCAKGLQDDGYAVQIYAAAEGGYAPGAPRAERLEDCAAGAAAVILGTPFSRDGKWINISRGDCAVSFSALCELLAPDGLILGGMLTDGAAELAGRYGVRTRDYFDCEEVAVLNAVPTAEGALGAAMELLPVTLCGARTGVIGYGRIGRALAVRLRALGSRVTAVARRAEQRALCVSDGIDAVGFPEIGELKGYDVIFNTVPEPVIGERELGLIGGSPIIELASAPGGIDLAAAKEKGCRVIHAPALPGRTAPVTAGRIIKASVARILGEEGIAP